LYHKILILLLFYCFAAAIGDCCVLDLDSISSYIKLLWVMFYDIPILKFSYWYYGLALPSLTYYWCILMCYDIDTQDQCMSNTKRIYFSMNFSQCVAWVLNHSKITTSFFCFRFRLWTRHPISLSSDKFSDKTIQILRWKVVINFSVLFLRNLHRNLYVEYTTNILVYFHLMNL
jgi:hypothetical protein